MKRITILLGIIQLLIALGAIPAGLLMVIEPDGAGMGMPTEVLSRSPFQSFLIPGLFLFIVNGLGNGMGAFFSFTKNRYAGFVGVALGIVLLLWIGVQVYFIGLNSFLQPLFFVIGVIEMILAYRIIPKTGKQSS
jgi:hypothetical protein